MEESKEDVQPDPQVKPESNVTAGAQAPQASFSSLVITLALSAMEQLNPKPPDKDRPAEPAKPELAKPMIDTLEILQEKTKGNLTKEEDELLGTVLLDLRLRYLRATKPGS
jgi:hypothetical protein